MKIVFSVLLAMVFIYNNCYSTSYSLEEDHKSVSQSHPEQGLTDIKQTSPDLDLEAVDLTDTLGIAVERYEAGGITLTEFRDILGQAQPKSDSNPVDMDIPKQEEDHSSTSVSVGQTTRNLGQKKNNSSDSSSHITVLWNKLPSQVRALLSVVPDLSYVIFLTTALLTKNEMALKTSMAFTIPYVGYFISNIPTRIEGCFRIIMKCSKLTCARPATT
jgi:hypothetical protein